MNHSTPGLPVLGSLWWTCTYCCIWNGYPTRTYCLPPNPLPSRGVWGRMDTCICMPETLHCSPETITTLLIGYTPIKQKKKFQNKRLIVQISTVKFVFLVSFLWVGGAVGLGGRWEKILYMLQYYLFLDCEFNHIFEQLLLHVYGKLSNCKIAWILLLSM